MKERRERIAHVTLMLLECDKLASDKACSESNSYGGNGSLARICKYTRKWSESIDSTI